jgi:hypothetical protein
LKKKRSNPDQQAARPPIDTLKKAPERLIRARKVFEIEKEYE